MRTLRFRTQQRRPAQKGRDSREYRPAACEFTFECRTLPGVDASVLLDEVAAYASTALVPEMRQRQKDAQIGFFTQASVPSFEADWASALVRWVTQVLGATRPSKAAYTTEAGQFQTAGIASVVCGPGSIEQAHKANEFVEVTQLRGCETFLEKLIATQQT